MQRHHFLRAVLGATALAVAASAMAQTEAPGISIGPAAALSAQ